MKMKDVRNSVSLKLVLGVLLVGCFLATPALAQSGKQQFYGKFQLTNNVRWGRTMLPPGAYSITLVRSGDSSASAELLTICDGNSGKIVLREFPLIKTNTAAENSKLLISVGGTERAVHSLQLAGVGEVYLYHEAHPLSSREGASEEARNTETIPIETAKL